MQGPYFALKLNIIYGKATVVFVPYKKTAKPEGQSAMENPRLGQKKERKKKKRKKV